MSAFNYFKECFTQKYADFNGRARRSEFWYFVLFSMLTVIVLGIVDGLLIRLIGFPILTPLFVLAQFIPNLAVTVRRLHDTDKSGWWILLSLIPLVGLVVLVFMCMDSTPGINQYGRNPKGIGLDEPIDHLVTDEI